MFKLNQGLLVPHRGPILGTVSTISGLLIILTFALIAGGIFSWKYWSEPVRTSDAVLNYEFFHWKLYVNKDYGFKIKYPRDADWEIKEKPLKQGFEIVFGQEQCVWISGIENPENFAVGEFYENFYLDFNETECKSSDGFCSCFRYALEYQKVSLPQPNSEKVSRCKLVPGALTSTVTFLSGNNVIYQIGKVYVDYAGYEGACASLDVNTVYRQMLSTFRFLE